MSLGYVLIHKNPDREFYLSDVQFEFIDAEMCDYFGVACDGDDWYQDWIDQIDDHLIKGGSLLGTMALDNVRANPKLLAAVRWLCLHYSIRRWNL